MPRPTKKGFIVEGGNGLFQIVAKYMAIVSFASIFAFHGFFFIHQSGDISAALSLSFTLTHTHSSRHILVCDALSFMSCS